MTTAIAPPSQRTFFVSDGFGITPQIYAKSGSKKKTYKGVAVFRTGTFRDSMGIQATWESLHLKQMMDNYSYLNNKNIIPSVPVRDGHPGVLLSGVPGRGAVVGWHESLEVKTLKSPIDSKEYDYLLADYTITEDYAQDKLDNGTWRNRSAEIGGYTTNDEVELWPVYMGFAWVDFSAVEGLNFTSSQGNRCYVFLNNNASREIAVTDTTAAQAAAGQGTVPNGTPLLPFGLPVPAPVAPAQPASPFSFTLNGQTSTDPTVVQNYINRLETWAREAREGARRSFVSSLVANNRVPAPQQAEYENFALGLSDDQYDNWTKMWGTIPPLALLGNHGGGVTNPTNAAQAAAPGTPGAVDQSVEDAKEIVKAHRRNGMPEDVLKATGSYQKLVTAGVEKA